MENMDKGFTVPKWVLIVRPKIPQNLSAQFVCSSRKVWDFKEKRLYWASVVRVYSQNLPKLTTTWKSLSTKTLLPLTKIRKGQGFGQSLAKKGQIFCKNLKRNIG